LLSLNRHREAIQLLSEYNSANPSPQIENQLSQLRHDAFFAIDRGAPQGEWPPTVVDHFKNSVGIPEVQASELDARIARSAVFNHGSLIIRNLLSADQTQSLINSTDQAFEAFDNAANLPDDQSWFKPFTTTHTQENLDGDRPFVRDGGGVLASESPRALFNLIKILEETGIVELVTQYLGERPALSVKKTTLRRVNPSLASKNGWHQDGAFLGKGIRTLNVWIALTDCGIDSPSMDMIPRRLREIVPTGTEGAWFDWSISPKMIDQVLAQGNFQHLTFKVGDAIIFDEMNLHQTSMTPEMTAQRYAVECWFFAPSCYPLDQLPILL
jgi:ectoine hydroxylase-related dioxygenase (phytanoyl-CoA dioxygenase family)